MKRIHIKANDNNDGFLISKDKRVFSVVSNKWTRGTWEVAQVNLKDWYTAELPQFYSQADAFEYVINELCRKSK